MSLLSNVNCNKIGSDMLSSKLHFSFIGYFYILQNLSLSHLLLQDVPMADTSNVTNVTDRLSKDFHNIAVSI